MREAQKAAGLRAAQEDGTAEKQSKRVGARTPSWTRLERQKNWPQLEKGERVKRQK